MLVYTQKLNVRKKHIHESEYNGKIYKFHKLNLDDGDFVNTWDVKPDIYDSVKEGSDYCFEVVLVPGTKDKPPKYWINDIAKGM